MPKENKKNSESKYCTHRFMSGFRNFTNKSPILAIWPLTGKSRFARKGKILEDFPPILGPIPIIP
jgi:hypothetical protein